MEHRQWVLYTDRHGIHRVKFTANPMKLNVINVARKNIKRKQNRKGNQKQKRHKKRSRGPGGGNNDLSNRTSGFHVDSDIVSEILSRLPVKSLVRFKGVCKHWRFLIEKDSYLIILHLNQSRKRPTLLFIVPTSFRLRWAVASQPCGRDSVFENRLELVIVELMLEENQRAVSTNTITKVEFPYENGGFFGPVNGLIGFHSKEYSATCICNISTQEVSPWIKSTFSGNVKGKERSPHYEMGFDPATKTHKVICIWGIYDSAMIWYPSKYDFLCEVLTVGDNKWRRIELPPFELETEFYKREHTVYVNGFIFIYFCSSTFMKAGKIGNEKILAFDVGAEKFRAITVPDFILNQPRHAKLENFNPDVVGDTRNHLIELEGRLARNMSDYTAKLWVFDDVHGNSFKEKNTGTSSSSNQNWTEVAIKLPYAWSADRNICFHAVAGTDHIVIESFDEVTSIFTRHLYNHRTKSCRKMDISGFEYFPSLTRVSGMVESLFHVQ